MYSKGMERFSRDQFQEQFRQLEQVEAKIDRLKFRNQLGVRQLTEQFCALGL